MGPCGPLVVPLCGPVVVPLCGPPLWSPCGCPGRPKPLVPRHRPRYSFLEFTQQFKRSYAKGSEEYRRREAIFAKSYERIHLVNARNAKEGRPWSSGIHPFMDWTDAERKRLHGYKPATRRDGGAVSRPGFM